ncbi:putative cytochrome P450 [Tripterygium wilfordii]|uniref:Putative cytochrome P450 n=1 Tax=Tripterygium wilfordii TaxID=458696 RepID=A0A7J7DNF1_TRIWF|nr:iridoid oxidase-like [Tripterygium wilfordii]KAF5747837.1 putative cytochrome P450 [Tripterygium wilfordii]
MVYTRSWLVLSSILLSAVLIMLLCQKRSRRGTKQTPPGPPGWPVFGNIFDLGAIPHKALYKLRFKYGPVVWLKLGSMNTMVIQSAKAAAELFKNHDQTFCDRKCLAGFTAHNYNRGSLALGQHGPYWSMLRRICKMDLLANKRINETAHLRRKCIDDMMQNIVEDATMAQAQGESGEVDLAHFLFLTSFNLIGNLVLSRDLVNSRSKEGHAFFNAMNEVMETLGKPNLADFLPFLKWLDPQKIMKNAEQHFGRVIKIVEAFVEERIEEYKSGREKKKQDFLDILLENEGDGKDGIDKISHHNLIILVLEMFLAGTETTSSTIEWGMAELFRNPRLMANVKEELDLVVGPNRRVEENDIDQLPYLQAVVKETLRLYPVIPLLLPRNSLRDTNYMGYQIPKDTQVFVNAWAIGRDPDSWEDPQCFKPERFLGSNIDYKGQHFELIPFGSGRRICVGMSLAQQVVPLVLGTLVHDFDWELSSNSSPETIDMTERGGITSRKLIPLKAIPRKRFM